MTGRMTGRRRESVNEMIAIMQRFEWDMAHAATREGRIPEEWRQVWEGQGRRKAKVSFWVDEDVVRFFRSLGPGYGPRMSRVLRSFMLARLGGMIERDDLLPEYRERWMGKAKPSVAEVMGWIEGLETMKGGRGKGNDSRL
jgi:uncharacterized protein (DUF4415 family)